MVHWNISKFKFSWIFHLNEQKRWLFFSLDLTDDIYTHPGTILPQFLTLIVWTCGLLNAFFLSPCVAVRSEVWVFAVFGAPWQCRGIVSNIWFTTQGATSTSYNVGMGLDKECRNLEWKGSYAGRAGSIGPRSHHWGRFLTPVGSIAIVPVNLPLSLSLSSPPPGGGTGPQKKIEKLVNFVYAYYQHLLMCITQGYAEFLCMSQRIRFGYSLVATSIGVKSKICIIGVLVCIHAECFLKCML